MNNGACVREIHKRVDLMPDTGTTVRWLMAHSADCYSKESSNSDLLK